jgi:hypothetical protein
VKNPPTDVGASVRARLLRLAREQAEDFQLLLTRYADKRLRFRHSASGHAQQFVLKGAALFTLWTGKPHRATRDFDLLGFGDPGVWRTCARSSRKCCWQHRALLCSGAEFVASKGWG